MTPKTLFFFVSLILLFSSINTAAEPRKCQQLPAQFFGITTESATVEELPKLLDALREMKRQNAPIPVIRVVFQYENAPSLYKSALKQIQSEKLAYVMGLLVDSQQMFHFNVRHENESITQRADEYASALGEFVDIWEVGNELNGEWVGWNGDNEIKIKGEKTEERERENSVELLKMRELVGKQIKAVHQTIQNRLTENKQCAQIALNLYFNDSNIESLHYPDESLPQCNACWWKECPDGCGHEYEMFTWAQKYLLPNYAALNDDDKKLKFDYVFFSFYEDDCEDVRPSAKLWARTFAKLSETFLTMNPVVKVGFGEVAPQCGETKNRRKDFCREQQVPYVKKYYGDINRGVIEEIQKLQGVKPVYVGGFFYWYFYQDATKKNLKKEDLKSREVLNSLIKTVKDWKQ